MASSRADLRAEFTSRMSLELAGEGKLLQALYSYMVADFGLRSPVGVVVSGGSDRSQLTFRGGKVGYLIDVFFFVLYAEFVEGKNDLNLGPTGVPTWSEQDSEAMADSIEEVFGEWIVRQETQHGNSWKSVAYNGSTETQLVFVGGVPYRQERIQLRFNNF